MWFDKNVYYSFHEIKHFFSTLNETFGAAVFFSWKCLSRRLEVAYRVNDKPIPVLCWSMIQKCFGQNFQKSVWQKHFSQLLLLKGSAIFLKPAFEYEAVNN